jgi:hypothetical protein
MAYIMNEGRALGQPSIYYYSVIHDGYKAQNFNDEVLKIALEDSIERIKVAKDAGED